jgi:hypothetical protein
LSRPIISLSIKSYKQSSDYADCLTHNKIFDYTGFRYS